MTTIQYTHRSHTHSDDLVDRHDMFLEFGRACRGWQIRAYTEDHSYVKIPTLEKEENMTMPPPPVRCLSSR